MQQDQRTPHREARGTKKRDKVPVYLMVVKRVSWYWYCYICSEHRLVLVAKLVVGPDAGVGLGLPNTKPTISKARLYTFAGRF